MRHTRRVIGGIVEWGATNLGATALTGSPAALSTQAMKVVRAAASTGVTVITRGAESVPLSSLRRSTARFPRLNERAGTQAARPPRVSRSARGSPREMKEVPTLGKITATGVRSL